VKPCLLIPIFDHKDEIGGVIDSLAPHGLPCLIVDDGSGEETREVLDALERQHPWVGVHHRSQNGGRGAALATGYRLAEKRGFSHAIQLDADGQHDARDVPRFLDAIATTPEALILGSPVFDDSVPRGRLYGRQLSRAMVWLTTLSFDVVDPLCGFHMEFDPELVIRLHWRGVPVCNVPTRVVYNEGGLSHFDMLWDNVRLSRVYARSVLGALVRLPALARRSIRAHERVAS
jgi:glycosyltransferase involved in cell wall biosynthesis